MEEVGEAFVTCTEKKCDNTSEWHKLYTFDDSSKDYILIEGYWGSLNKVRCEKCVPKSYKECINCRSRTQKTCSVTSCDAPMCKVHQELGVGEHEWSHGPSKAL